ncbi:MAG: outer membrane lipoprotein carrier protein LolA [Flavobacteriaceae bacterium]|jgi:outer membrane lipoprotein-sorting protein|nr:outer membrane lipoprotein carrier protein LolA [Flavobacteriaceae bacterium]MBT3754245.1 outer membrane lipoprotein carrier protein LolA [Flavobacteriaceae bacterium]MBT5396143.1 outer membrane lipoprotein carrier protein LolA [Flavobacteriaceae bacterium]MBT5596796.1 outer membrane lipoprotein carrier protein LolA [Flavobacteriaceae bacterium]MBT5857065.1 outer membrane lipoprotein carrier protein LolA [Flavobacteriaceae bacterium]
MKNILFLIALLIFNIVLSQNDSKAENLLNKVSEKIDNAKSYQIDFTYTLENTLDGINQDLKGTIIIENDNYLLNFMGINQICDSEYIYTIVEENEEVLISSIGNEDQQTIKPSQLLKFYRNGYLLLWDKIEISYEERIQFLKLIPIDSYSETSYLLLGINVSENNISKLIEIGKNKTKTILKVDSIIYNPEIKDNIFVFNKNEYKNYYIENL